MNFPDNFRYTREHEWVSVEDGVATVGVTSFAGQELGEIVFVELPDKGRVVKTGESLCVLESTKAASDVYAPIGGKVLEVNAALSTTPELINASPHDQGWMVKLGEADVASFKKLMTAEEYQAFLNTKE